jgi:hypothetical protein
VNVKHWERGRAHFYFGVARRYGFEFTVEFDTFSVVLHVVNVYAVFEYWPRNVGG